LSGKLPRT